MEVNNQLNVSFFQTKRGPHNLEVEWLDRNYHVKRKTYVPKYLKGEGLVSRFRWHPAGFPKLATHRGAYKRNVMMTVNAMDMWDTEQGMANYANDKNEAYVLCEYNVEIGKLVHTEWGSYRIE